MGVCVLQVTLAYESIVLYMCEGKVLMDIKNQARYEISRPNPLTLTLFTWRTVHLMELKFM